MSKFNDVMIDIETLGTGPYSCLLSIACVEFNPRTGQTGKDFYCVIDPVSCQKNGLKIDADTVLWWFMQSNEAQSEFTDIKSRIDIKKSLILLSKFIKKCGVGVNVWANSPSFDCSRIREAYEVIGMSAPWTYKQERDYRTIIAQYPYSLPKNENRISHKALDDCYNQIDRLVFITDFIIGRQKSIHEANRSITDARTM